jgi:hypothetical protein
MMNNYLERCLQWKSSWLQSMHFFEIRHIILYKLYSWSRREMYYINVYIFAVVNRILQIVVQIIIYVYSLSRSIWIYFFEGSSIHITICSSYIYKYRKRYYDTIQYYIVYNTHRGRYARYIHHYVQDTTYFAVPWTPDDPICLRAFYFKSLTVSCVCGGPVSV